MALPGGRIACQCREQEKVNEQGYAHHEVRCGFFARTVRLPEGATESDIHGQLQRRDPRDPHTGPRGRAATKIPIAKT